MKTRLRKHSVLIAGHETSVTLEDVFWDALKATAKDQGLSLNALVTDIDAHRAEEEEPGNLSGAIRVYLFERLSGSTDP